MDQKAEPKPQDREKWLQDPKTKMWVSSKGRFSSAKPQAVDIRDMLEELTGGAFGKDV